MGRVTGCLYTAAAFLAAQHVALPLAMVKMPTGWVYDLSPACYWTPKPWTGGQAPAVPKLTPADRRAEWRCLKGRGLKSMVIFSAHIEDRWPSQAMLTRWESEDAQNDNPPRPDWRYTAEPE